MQVARKPNSRGSSKSAPSVDNPAVAPPPRASAQYRPRYSVFRMKDEEAEDEAKEKDLEGGLGDKAETQRAEGEKDTKAGQDGGGEAGGAAAKLAFWQKLDSKGIL